MDFYFWKWTIGEPYYKSARREVKVEQEYKVSAKLVAAQYKKMTKLTLKL